MLDPHISEEEKKCVRIFAKLFKNGDNHARNPREALRVEGLDLAYKDYEVLMRMMEKYGVIEAPTHVLADEGYYVMFRISADAIRIEREIDSLEKQVKEPEDIVGKVNESVRSNPWLAFVLIAFFVLMAAATFINQTISIFQNVGWMAKP